MGIFEWLFEKPKRDYFDDIGSCAVLEYQSKERFQTASSTVKRSDINIMNMRVGDYVTYRSIDYYVRQRYLYKAGRYEWLAYQFSDTSRQNTLWLDVEEDDEVNIEMTKPVNIPTGVTVSTLKSQKPFTYQGELYEYDEHGYAQVKIEKESRRWEEDTVEYWDYCNRSETQYISFEKWGEELEATIGHPIKDFELEIYPGS